MAYLQQSLGVPKPSKAPSSAPPPPPPPPPRQNAAPRPSKAPNKAQTCENDKFAATIADLEAAVQQCANESLRTFQCIHPSSNALQSLTSKIKLLQERIMHDKAKYESSYMQGLRAQKRNLGSTENPATAKFRGQIDMMLGKLDAELQKITRQQQADRDQSVQLIVEDTQRKVEAAEKLLSSVTKIERPVWGESEREHTARVKRECESVAKEIDTARNVAWLALANAKRDLVQSLAHDDHGVDVGTEKVKDLQERIDRIATRTNDFRLRIAQLHVKRELDDMVARFVDIETEMISVADVLGALLHGDGAIASIDQLQVTHEKQNGRIHALEAKFKDLQRFVQTKQRELGKEKDASGGFVKIENHVSSAQKELDNLHQLIKASSALVQRRISLDDEDHKMTKIEEELSWVDALVSRTGNAGLGLQDITSVFAITNTVPTSVIHSMERIDNFMIDAPASLKPAYDKLLIRASKCEDQVVEVRKQIQSEWSVAAGQALAKEAFEKTNAAEDALKKASEAERPSCKRGEALLRPDAMELIERSETAFDMARKLVVEAYDSITSQRQEMEQLPETISVLAGHQFSELESRLTDVSERLHEFKTDTESRKREIMSQVAKQKASESDSAANHQIRKGSQEGSHAKTKNREAIEPGLYKIVPEKGIDVTPSERKSKAVVSALPKGTVVNVVEVKKFPEADRIRGRIDTPQVEGWISLVRPSDGYRFATQVDIEEFIADEGVDKEAAKSLRDLDRSLQQIVISAGPLVGRNPSAMLNGRIRDARASRQKKRIVEAANRMNRTRASSSQKPKGWIAKTILKRGVAPAARLTARQRDRKKTLIRASRKPRENGASQGTSKSSRQGEPRAKSRGKLMLVSNAKVSDRMSTVENDHYTKRDSGISSGSGSGNADRLTERHQASRTSASSSNRNVERPGSSSRVGRVSLQKRSRTPLRPPKRYENCNGRSSFLDHYKTSGKGEVEQKVRSRSESRHRSRMNRQDWEDRGEPRKSASISLRGREDRKSEDVAQIGRVSLKPSILRSRSPTRRSVTLQSRNPTPRRNR